MNVDTKIFNYRILLWLVKRMLFILNLLTFTIRLIPFRAFSSIIYSRHSLSGEKWNSKLSKERGSLVLEFDGYALCNQIHNAVGSWCKMSIPDFFAGKTIFLTGATGSVGSVFLEKLLRSCKGVKKVYLLIRPKNGILAQERIRRFLQLPVSVLFQSNLIRFFIYFLHLKYLYCC